MINQYKSTVYGHTMLIAAEKCGFISRPKLFEFLRRYGIIVGSYPAPEFIIMGYFTVANHNVRHDGQILKTVPQIFVTEAGIKFIKNLHKLITKDVYVPHFAHK